MLVSFAVVTVLFAMMFKWLPDVSVAWRDVWLGAFLTALFFEMGKAAIGFYIGKQGLESTYGAAASIVVVLIWVYYTSQIILMGAEVTHSYAKHNGSLKGATHRAPERAIEPSCLARQRAASEIKGHRRFRYENGPCLTPLCPAIPDAERLPAGRSNCFSLRASIGAALF